MIEIFGFYYVIEGCDEPLDCMKKRRLISTIVTSPSRSLLDHTPSTTFCGRSGHGNYVGYCKIRSGIPLHEFTGLSTKHKSVSNEITNSDNSVETNLEKGTLMVASVSNTGCQDATTLLGVGAKTLNDKKSEWPKSRNSKLSKFKCRKAIITNDFKILNKKLRTQRCRKKFRSKANITMLEITKSEITN